MSARAVLRRAMPSAWRFAPAVLWGVLSAAAAVSLIAVSGWLIVSASIVNTIVVLSVAVVGVRFFAVSRAVFRYLERLMGHEAALRQVASTRSDLVRRLIPLSPAGLGSTDRGEALSALVDDGDNLLNLPVRVVQPLVTAAVVSLGAVVVVTIISVPAGLTLLGCLVLAAAAALGLGWLLAARAERALSGRRAELSGALIDYLANLDVLQAYGAEAAARQRLTVADAAVRQAVTRASFGQAVAAGIVSMCAGLASIAAVWVGSGQVAAGMLDGPWLAVTVLVPMALFEVFGAVPIAAASWRSVRSSAERIADLVPDTLPAELRSDAGADAEITEPSLVLRDVRAHWPGGVPALRGVDLAVAPGERVLVTGASGAGKSSLAAVLVGFLRADGEYLLGGRPAAELSGETLRTTIGLCEQQPHLFDEDIRQNLLFARDTATDDELLAVLDRVGLAEWVTERGGLDARVGERGALVSGGQAQRIALARCLLRGFDVLVLDEPTAGVDAAASDALLIDLMDAAHGRTVLLISHVAPPAGTIDREVRLAGGRTVG